MGLDLCFYSDCREIPDNTPPDAFDALQDNCNIAYVSRDFPRSRALPITTDRVACHNRVGHFSRSYGGYNAVRDYLSRLCIDVPAKQAWEQPSVYESHSLFPLVNFSDCDGFIGATDCAKIAACLAEHQETDRATTDRPTNFTHADYLALLRCFEAVGPNGGVSFQ